MKPDAAQKSADAAPRPADGLKEHNDRLERIEKILGIAHKADEMKSEDQTKGKSPSYGRKRH